MHNILIAYATHEGHTGVVAEHLANTLEGQGCTVTVHDLGTGPIDPMPFDRVLVASSVHLGQHDRGLTRFVKAERHALEAKEAALISVGGATAAAEHATDPKKRAQYQNDARNAVAELTRRTGWKPAHVEYVAGAFLYSQYSWLVRFIMKNIARSEGLSTDTTQDHDYTNWAALDRYAAELINEAPTDAPRS